ncbi:MAG: NADH-quinone oxidoreductase subunit D, partial [Dehalococcoidia bacterium]|nr:NADH-quinone oxidoreductase subunit D [Dehalococcoidia bacterium]
TYLRVGGVSQDLPEEFIPAVKRLITDLRKAVDEYEALLSSNEILLARMKGVGILPPELAINASASGPVLRGSGIRWDIRRAEPYSIYDRFQFDIPVGQNGDCYDRYWVRVEEMKQSLNIIEQAIKDLPGGEICAKVPSLLRPPKGEAYGHIEAPRGDLGFYIVSDGSIAPYRVHIKPPTLINLTTMRDLCVGWKIADFIVIFGSIDVVLGEMDR